MKPINRYFLCLYVVLGLALEVQAGGYDAWGFRSKIQFTGYTQSETLTNFPVLVKLDSVIVTNFSYGQFRSGTNGDLRFVDATGTTALNYEIERWDTNGTSLVWVQVPALGSTNDFIYAYWGRDGQSGLACTTNGAVWDDNFRGVWHFPDGVTLSAGDSTTNRNNGGLSNGVAATSGNIGGGANFDGLDDYVDIARQLLSGSDDFTISMWIKSGGSQNAYACPIAQGTVNYNGFSFQFGYPSSTDLNLIWGDASTWRWVGFNYNLATDTSWRFLSATKSGNTITTFKDGIQQNQNSLYAFVYGTHNLNIGRETRITDSNHRTFKGALDEVSISGVARSSNWVWACYLNTASNGLFQTYGTEEVVGGLGPVVQNRAATLVTTNSATLNGYLVTTGTAPTTVSVYWGDADGGAPTSGLWKATNTWAVGTWVDGSYPSYPASGLTPDTIYYYRYGTTNAIDGTWASDTTNFLAGRIWVTGGIAAEAGAVPGTFTVWRASSATGTATTVNFIISGGTASNGVDYTMSPARTVTIPEGQSSAVVVVTPIFDLIAESDKVVELVIQPGLYVVGAGSNATVTITDAGGGLYGTWGYRSKIQFTGYTRSETLTNFPALVKLDSVSVTNFNYGQFQSGLNGDLRFVDSTGLTALNYEIESWDTNGTSLVWVQVPTLGSTNDFIYAYWGRAWQSAPACTTNGTVWEANFRGVWHFPDGATLSADDSTTNRNDGGLSNGVAATSGYIGGAANFDGADDYVDIARQLLSGSDDFTISMWIKSGGSQNTYACPIAQGPGNYNGFSFQYGYPSLTDLNLIWGDASTWRWVGFNYNLATDTSWHFLSATKSGNTITTFKDGVQQNQNSSYAFVYGTHNLNIGRDTQNADSNHRTFKGALDEVRISGIARSSNWVWACYQNTASNGVFQTYGTEEVIPPVMGSIYLIR